MIPQELADEKKFYDRFWALHSDPDLVAIFARFGYRAFRRSSVLEGFSRVIQSNAFRGRRCIEIGTCSGLTAVVLARHFDEVISIDVEPSEFKHEIIKYRGIQNVRFVEVKDNAEKAEVVRSVSSFDGAYVDGDHARDTQSDFDLVKRCGRVLFHEYWEAQPPVFNLVNDLRSQGSVVTDGKLALWTN